MHGGSWPQTYNQPTILSYHLHILYFCLELLENSFPSLFSHLIQKSDMETFFQLVFHAPKNVSLLDYFIRSEKRDGKDIHNIFNDMLIELSIAENQIKPYATRLLDDLFKLLCC